MPARTITVEVLELPFPPADRAADRAPVEAPVQACHRAGSPFGTFDECPMCGGAMSPEHAHFRCTSCGWRDSCCD